MHETEWAASRPHVSSECNCHDLHIFLYELVDNELTDEDCRRLKHHISECPACAEKVAAETALREVLHWGSNWNFKHGFKKCRFNWY